MKKISIILAIILVIGFTHQAQAKTLDQIRNEIASLTKQIQALSQQALALIATQEEQPSVSEEQINNLIVNKNPLSNLNNENQNTSIEYPTPFILNKKGGEEGNSCGLNLSGEKLFAMSGLSNSKRFSLNDVWSTIDGVTWINEKQDVPFTKRFGAQVLYVNNMFYLFGGVGDGDKNISTYVSKNAKDWVEYGKLPGAALQVGGQFSVAYYDSKFWLIDFNETAKQGVSLYTSDDAKQWKKTSNSPSIFAGLRPHGDVHLYVFKSKLWLIGANPIISPATPFGESQNWSWLTGKYEMKIWSTTDGVNWTYESSPNVLTENIPGFRMDSHPFVFNSKVWIIGGTMDHGVTPENQIQKDVYSSNDGKTWNQITNKLPFSNWNLLRIGFKNKLFAIGHTNQWYSSNGSSWTQEKFNNKPPTTFLDRYMTTGVAIPFYASNKAPDLKITSTNASTITTLLDKKTIKTNQILGTWDFSAVSKNNNAKYSGTIKISSIGLLGTDTVTSPKFAPVKFSSSLESLRNIKVFVDDGGSMNYKQVGFITKFNGPFYDTVNNYALTQMINLSSPITLIQDQTKHVYITADFTFSSKLPQLTTYISGFGSPDSNSEPCTTYNGDINGTYGLYKGITIKNGNPVTGTTSIPSAGTGKPTTTITNPVLKMP